MPIKVLFICALFLFASLPLAHADERFEIRPKQGLILVEDFKQWLSTEYEYAGAESPGISNASHTFQERYNLMADTAIIDPRLLRLQLSGSFWGQQANSSSTLRGTVSSNRLEYQYNVSGTAFDTEWHPIAFNTSRNLNTVVSPYVPAYTADSTSTGIECSFRKGPIPTTFGYQRTSLDASGGGNNTSMTSDQLHLSLQNSYRDISNSSLNATWSGQRASGQDSSTYSISFSNGTFFGPTRNYSLTSSLSQDELKLAGVPQSNLYLMEILHARLGRALESDLSYSYNSNSTTDFSGHDQLSQTSLVTASVSHQLFENLATRLNGHYKTNDLLGGTENAYGGLASVRYSRRLPADSRLTLDFSGSHEITDRNLATSELSVRDEPQPPVGPQQNDSFTLGKSGLLVRVVTVKSKNPVDPQYTEGADYTVDLLLHRINIIPGGQIAPGTILLVSYVVSIDPSVKYATDLYSAATAVSFLTHYTLSASFTSQQSSYISGQPMVDLTNVETELFRFMALFPEYNYTLSYTGFSSNRSKYRTVEGGWQFTRHFAVSSISLQLRDTYAMYDAVGSAPAYTHNDFSTTSTYQRQLLWGSQLELSANYTDTSSGGGVGETQFLFLNGKLQAQFNKVAVSLGGQVAWRLYGNRSSRNDYAQVTVMRYF